MTLDEAMAASPLFAPLDQHDRERIIWRMTIATFDPSEVVVSQGDAATAFYLILSGRVEVTHAADTDRRAATSLAMLGPGDVFGEMALLDDGTRSSSVIARVPTRCALLSQWDFREELRRSPEVAIRLLAILSRRIRRLDERLARAAALGRTGAACRCTVARLHLPIHPGEEAGPRDPR
jgi:CRP/FNR family transcriptional regulator, cyclic AMP receptor protein